MKILKALLWAIGLLLVSFLLLAAFSKKDFTNSQSTVINAPQSLVFNTVNDLSTWDSWSPWSEMDPTNVTTLGEKYIGKGGNYTWNGEKMGSGKMSITDAVSPSKISTKVEFDGQGHADADFTFEPVDGGTKTSWSFHSRTPFPMNALMVLMGVEKQVGKDYARGLELLKGKVETLASRKPSGLAVKEVDYPGQTYIVHRDKIGFENIAMFYQKNLPALFGAAQKNKIEMTGMPCGLFFSWDMENNQSDMAAAIPVSGNANLPRGMKHFSTKPGKALQVDYYGDYSGTAKAHDAIEAHMKANNQELAWPCIESYITDPTTEPDTSKWLTQVIYPLQ